MTCWFFEISRDLRDWVISDALLELMDLTTGCGFRLPTCFCWFLEFKGLILVVFDFMQASITVI